MIVELAAFFVSTTIGIIAALIGLGGGFLYVPSLTLIFGLDPRMAVGTSLAVMICSSFAASFVYRNQGKILYKAALVLCIPSIIFSVLSSIVTNYIDTKIIVLIFGLILILISFEILLPGLYLIRKFKIGPSLVIKCRDHGGDEKEICLPYFHLIFYGAIGGIVSGITGTSGGAFFVPALVVLGIPVHVAVATSLLTIIPTAISGATTHALLGHLSVPFLVTYGAGAAIGAYAGACLAPRIHADHIKRIFGVMLLFIALVMIQQKVLGL